MSKFDWSDLDARLLQLLVAVVDSGSITAAAQHLGVTQSAVSHQLDKLRTIVGDPLFVKSGRGIVATAHALRLTVQARGLLEQLEHLARLADFDPAQWRTTFTVAANDFQREVLLPTLMQRLDQTAPGVVLRVLPSDIPTPDMLRHGQCDLIVSPRPPDASDILQKRLFEDGYRVFYDPAHRPQPPSLAEYLAADHVSVRYGPQQRPLDIDRHLQAQGVQRRFKVLVPGFSALRSFLLGSARLATVPGLLAGHGLQGLASAETPLTCPRMPMYLIWHQRHHQDSAHHWMRQQLEAVVPLLGQG